MQREITSGGRLASRRPQRYNSCNLFLTPTTRECLFKTLNDELLPKTEQCHAQKMAAMLALNFIEGSFNFAMRGMKQRNGAERWSVYDFINQACEKPANSKYGCNLFNDLIKEGANKDDLLKLTEYHRFYGKRC